MIKTKNTQTEVTCLNCEYHVYDNKWGEYKCKKNSRTCSKSELAMGCSDWKKLGSKADDPTPEIVVRSGATFIPHVSKSGVISWTNDKGLTNPDPVQLTAGLDGKDGAPGKDGVDGKDGKDGYTPIKGVDYFDGAPGKDGKDGIDGRTPEKGVDYFTDEDKQEFIEEVLENIDIPEGGGGGVTSWNDLKDKPFEEMPPVFDITWDGDMTGHEILQPQDNIYFVKVSDEVFTKEQLLNSIIFDSDGYESVNTDENIFVYDDQGLIEFDGGMVISDAKAFINSTELPEGSVSNGVWFYNWTGEEPYYVNRFVAATTIKTIDEKYIPDTIATKEDVAEAIENIDIEISWNDITDKPFEEEFWWTHQEALIIKQVTTSGDITSGTWQNVSVNLVVGQRYKIVVIDYVNNKVLCEWENVATQNFTNPSLIRVEGNSTDIVLSYDYIFKSTGLKYIGEKPSSSLVNVVIYNEDATIKPLDEKYIPDTIARVSDIPSAEDFATKQYVDEAIENIDIPESSGGVTSWNDLTDKPFGELKDYIELWAEVSFDGSSHKILTTPSTSFTEGDICRYVYDGIVYETQIVKYTSGSDYWVIGGNPYVVGSFPNNGQPAAFWYFSGNKTYFVKSKSQIKENHTFSAEIVETVIKPLDKKFLPDTVVLESELDAKGYQTEEQVTELINNALEGIENGTY
jgi:hypothetical protein